MTAISEQWCNVLATAAGMLEDGEVTASIVGVTELMRDDGAGSEEEAGCCHGIDDVVGVVWWNGRGGGRSGKELQSGCVLLDSMGTGWSLSE